MLMIFTKFIDVEQRFTRKGRMMEILVSFDGSKNLTNFISEITSYNYCITSFEYVDLQDDESWQEKLEKEAAFDKKAVNVNLHITLPKHNHHSEILKVLENSKGMIAMEEI